jgi:hypothetical protein
MAELGLLDMLFTKPIYQAKPISLFVGKYVTHDCKAGTPNFCTTNDNIKARQNGFDVSKLPKTFRNAVRVAQNLGIQYLWINSLCIIQGNQEDWKSEAKRMQDVYAGTYCTIAATSAVDSNAGFLERTALSEYLHIEDTSGR